MRERHKSASLTSFFFLLRCFPSPCPSDLQHCTGDEVCCPFQLIVGAQELFSQGGLVRPHLCPEVLDEKALLKNCFELGGPISFGQFGVCNIPRRCRWKRTQHCPGEKSQIAGGAGGGVLHCPECAPSPFWSSY